MHGLSMCVQIAVLKGNFKNMVNNPYSNQHSYRELVSMAKFKIIISDPETGKSQAVELEDARAVPLVGSMLGEVLDGATVGLGGHKLKITGGSDKDGFPMRPDIHGGVKTRVVIAKGVGFHSNRNGERKRKTLRGRVITEEISQINMKIIEKPKKAKKEQKKAKPTDAKSEKVEKESKETKKPEEPKKEPRDMKEEI